VVLQAVKRLVSTCASRDVTFLEVEKGEHELFMGKHWISVTKAMAEWILAAAIAKRREEAAT
jgi:alpha-beta hydrolase superfamily lysophospholipase